MLKHNAPPKSIETCCQCNFLQLNECNHRSKATVGASLASTDTTCRLKVDGTLKTVIENELQQKGLEPVRCLM